MSRARASTAAPELAAMTSLRLDSRLRGPERALLLLPLPLPPWEAALSAASLASR